MWSSLLLKLLPEFIVHRFLNGKDGEEETRRSQKARFTSLDGLRGIGALVVVHSHLFGPFEKTLGTPLGLSREQAQTCGILAENGAWDPRFSIHNIPVVNTMFMGPLWVNVFFVLSGFVLSQRPLGLAKADELESLLKSLSSALLRRPIRLFVPAYAIILPTVLLLQAGALMLHPPHVSPLDHWGDFGVPRRFPTFWLQLKDMIWSYWHLADPYDWRLDFGPYDPPLWTINLEFHGSLLIFVTVLAFCKVRTRLRLMFISLMVIDSYLRYHWDASLFLLGMLVSESVLISDERRTRRQREVTGDINDQSNLPHNRTFPRWTRKLLWIVTYLLTVYLVSAPLKCPGFSPAYGWLRHWPLRTIFWPYKIGGCLLPHSVGSVLLVFLVSHSPRESWIRKFFLDTRPIQYLGRISFSLYLTHWLVLHLFGFRLLIKVWKFVGRENYGMYVLGSILAYLILLLPLLWVAELFCRAVDEPSIRLAHELAQKVMRQENRVILA